MKYAHYYPAHLEGGSGLHLNFKLDSIKLILLTPGAWHCEMEFSGRGLSGVKREKKL